MDFRIGIELIHSLIFKDITCRRGVKKPFHLGELLNMPHLYDVKL